MNKNNKLKISMKKLLLILCLTAASINAMERYPNEAATYVQKLRNLSEQAAALAAKKDPSKDELGVLITQKESIDADYAAYEFKDTATSHATQEAPMPRAAIPINDLRQSITDYITMINAKIDKTQ